MLDIVHPQDAGALEHRVVHRVLDGSGPEVVRLEYEHRLDPGGGAGGGYELAAVAGVLHVHQDGAGIAIPQQVIDQVAQIHVPADAYRDRVREADAATGGPIDHAAHNCGRLAQQGDVARQRPGPIQTGVDVGRRRCITEVIRTHDPQQIGLGGFQDLLLQGFALIRVFAQHLRTQQRRLDAAMVLQHIPAE